MELETKKEFKKVFSRSAAASIGTTAGAVSPYLLLGVGVLAAVLYINHRYSVSHRISEAKTEMDAAINERYQTKYEMTDDQVKNLQADVRAGYITPVPEEEAARLREMGIEVATPEEFEEWYNDPNAYMRKVKKEQRWEY